MAAVRSREVARKPYFRPNRKCLIRRCEKPAICAAHNHVFFLHLSGNPIYPRISDPEVIGYAGVRCVFTISLRRNRSVRSARR